jgi:hypothetical protein
MIITDVRDFGQAGDDSPEWRRAAATAEGIAADTSHAGGDAYGVGAETRDCDRIVPAFNGGIRSSQRVAGTVRER